ncbi:MFS transporter protein [Rutstroemia sp. NJR-2017a WRK4]|nr:MFS transporter protein [Rutstroemia sp. NJR-2017a WRK4]
MSSPSNPPISPLDEEKLPNTNINIIDTSSSTPTPPPPPIDPVLEKALLRKLDIHVVIPLTILFLLAFLDRVNIGNAKIQGMTQDLHMQGNDYNIALLIFFPPYILFELPSNLILRRISPSTWITFIMTSWGIITICQGLVHSHAALVGLRFLLGLFEAGFSPGAVYLISMYYKRYELQWRLSVFFAASILAGGFGGLFAYALAHMDGVGGYKGWRWIFIIEGLLTIVVVLSLKAFGGIADWPESATFLTPHERVLVLQRLASDTGVGGEEIGRLDKLNRKSLKRILADWKIWVGALMYFGVVNTGYATSFFIPTILHEMGYTAIASQVRSIPIFCVAAVLALVTARLTDYFQHRFLFTIIGVVVGTTGYIILLCQTHVTTGVKYMACFFIVSGGYITQPVTWTWLANNTSGHYKRSITSALQIGLGSCGGLVASNIFITNQAPLYPVGYGTSLGMLLLCGCMCVTFFFGLRRENALRERDGRDYRYSGEERKELGNMGDDHPGFRFVL